MGTFMNTLYTKRVIQTYNRVIRYKTQKKPGILNEYRVFFLAEKEGFEPSIPFWGIHDFQSCALGQLRDFSISQLFRSQLEYNTTKV